MLILSTNASIMFLVNLSALSSYEVGTYQKDNFHNVINLKRDKYTAIHKKANEGLPVLFLL